MHLMYFTEQPMSAQGVRWRPGTMPRRGRRSRAIHGKVPRLRTRCRSRKSVPGSTSSAQWLCPSYDAYGSTGDAAAEIARRRTFAIISHPDAGKTTLTEKLLLFGGAIHTAGSVKARRAARHATSDWMKLEQERGISITSSVLQFEWQDHQMNLLDTPGHQDFSEDTYRTLTAADAAVMVLDAAKGIEPQTLKLFEVCRMRDIPIVTFINKMDREAQDPFELLDEIASKLALDPAPLYWPAGSGGRFKGMLDLRRERFLPFAKKTGGAKDEDEGHPQAIPFKGNAIVSYLDPDEQEELAENAELALGGLKAFDPQSFLEGHMTPVFFGSALRHFGVDQLLEGLGAYAPPPKAVAATKGGDPIHVAPGDREVSGFVFKVQANMDPNHRDRVAFMRVCSGRFRRGMKLRQTRTGKSLAIHSPIFFFAQDRELAEEAFAGDIIGVPNHGKLRIGDTLSANGPIRIERMPRFSPEQLDAQLDRQSCHGDRAR